jgi:hypothetical protein
VKAAYLGILVLACASCAHDEDAAGPQPATGGFSAAERTDALEWAKDGADGEELVTWAETIAASKKMQDELDAIYKEFGFVRDARFEEHPSEAASYVVVLTRTGDEKPAAMSIADRLRRASVLFKVGRDTEGELELQLEPAETKADEPEEYEMISGVTFYSDGRGKFENSHNLKPFMAITVGHVLWRKEWNEEP